MARELKASRYLTADNEELSNFIVTELPFLDFWQTMEFYQHVETALDDKAKALMNANDRYYLLTVTCKRVDAWHEWIFDRCREVESKPDGYLDLWARYHYKSSICTFAGCIQETIIDPEIKIAILSCKNDVARPFLVQIKNELERNEDLKRIHSDVFYDDPENESPKWSEKEGIVVKRRGNPREPTMSAYGLIDGMPVGSHFDLLNYDDLVTDTLVGNPDMIKKVTIAWELSDNLGTAKVTRKWHQGTRYSFADTYGILLDRRALKERRYPATDDGTVKGTPVFLTQEKWDQVKLAQQSTVNAQMLLNPLAGTESTFRTRMLRHYDVVPSVLNVYILCDPSKGRGPRSDRTAIAVMGVDVGGNKYLLDGVCHRMKLSERWQLIKQYESKWRNHPGVQMVRIGYEQYGMQSDIEVLNENMQREGNYFLIEEVNSSKDGSGKNAKNDRIERLEPDMNRGMLYIPAVVYHPDFGRTVAGEPSYNTAALWDVWTEKDHNMAAEAGMKENPAVDTIVYRPMIGPTKLQRYCAATFQNHRVVTALRRRDERGDMYDLTRAFMEEMRLHPFAPHDDLIDAVSRIYDMEPKAPVQFETMKAEPTIHLDS
jgi:hypothetical protein